MAHNFRRKTSLSCDAESLHREVQHLKDVFLHKGYGKKDIRWALHPKQKPQAKEEEPTGIAVLPYQQAITNKICRLLAKHIKTIRVPRKNMHMLRPVKDDLDLKVSGVYRIPCECGEVYVGQTGRSIEARCKERQRHIRLERPEKSAVAEHSINTGRRIDSSGTYILDTAAGYRNRLVKEAIEIRLNFNNFNRDGDHILSRARYPVINMTSRASS
jgi:hypothetical protein